MAGPSRLPLVAFGIMIAICLTLFDNGGCLILGGLWTTTSFLISRLLGWIFTKSVRAYKPGLAAESNSAAGVALVSAVHSVTVAVLSTMAFVGNSGLMADLLNTTSALVRITVSVALGFYMFALSRLRFSKTEGELPQFLRFLVMFLICTTCLYECRGAPYVCAMLILEFHGFNLALRNALVHAWPRSTAFFFNTVFLLTSYLPLRVTVYVWLLVRLAGDIGHFSSPWVGRWLAALVFSALVVDVDLFLTLLSQDGPVVREMMCSVRRARPRPAATQRARTADRSDLTPEVILPLGAPVEASISAAALLQHR